MLLRVLALAALVGLAGSAVAPAAAPPASAHRIVSLIPSLTEDLFAVGAGSQVVGVSEYSDVPSQARRLPRISSYAAVDTERVVALHPDLVLGIPEQRAMVRDLRRAGIRTVLVSDESFSDIFADLHVVGALSGHAAAADRLVANLRARTHRLLRDVAPGRRPSVLVVLGEAPIYTAGHGSFIAELIALAGGRNAADEIAAPYGAYSAEAIVAKQPDVVLLDREVRLDAIADRAPWNALHAVRSGHAYSVPSTVPLFRPGPRYNDALAWLIATFRRARSS